MTVIPAGDFRTWVRTTTEAWETGADVVVPCGECNACCRSGFFVHVGPRETATLERIPKALRFPAPGKPKGWIVLPHDEHGRCAMLGGDGRCTIYDTRPLTCRHFDCRVYVAAGIDAPGPIRDRTVQWRFDAETDDVRAIAVTQTDRDTDRAARAVSLSTIGLRPARDGDTEWLYELHRAAMREPVEQVYGPWDEEQQRRFFARRDPSEVVHVITKRGSRVGTLRTKDNDDGSLDVALLEVHPKHQGTGIGSEVLRRLAARTRRDLTLQVMKENRARHLYDRLGFELTGETATHLQLRRASSLLFETDPV